MQVTISVTENKELDGRDWQYSLTAPVDDIYDAIRVFEDTIQIMGFSYIEALVAQAKDGGLFKTDL